VISRETEAAGIFATHGLLDGLTTVAAALTHGVSGELNPVLSFLLSIGPGWALGSMIFVTGCVAASWPTLATRYEIPRWFAPALCLVGLAVSVGNLAVIVT